MCWNKGGNYFFLSTHIRNICLILFCHPSKLQQGHSWHFHQINLVRWPTTSNHFLTCVEIKTLQQDNCPLRCTLKTENIKVVHFLNFLTCYLFRDIEGETQYLYYWISYCLLLYNMESLYRGQSRDKEKGGCAGGNAYLTSCPGQQMYYKGKNVIVNVSLFHF